MKLHFARPSPYVRKVCAVAIELGLDERIERLERAMTPVSPEAELNADNPLGKVPCLITDDGEALYDSRVICAYLDELADGRTVIPDRRPGALDGASARSARRRHSRCRRRSSLRDFSSAEGISLGRLDRRAAGEVHKKSRSARARGGELRRPRRHRHHRGRLRLRLHGLPLRRRTLARHPSDPRRLVRNLLQTLLDRDHDPWITAIRSTPRRAAG